jgi:hypothetical protein
VKPKKALIIQGVKMDGFGFDYCDFPSDASDPFQAGQWLLHVVQNTEVEHDVEHAECFEVHRREVADVSLNFGTQGDRGKVKTSAARKIR